MKKNRNSQELFLELYKEYLPIVFKQFRVNFLHMTQEQVAKEIKSTVQCVSNTETITGNTRRNGKVMLYYVLHGLDCDKIATIVEYIDTMYKKGRLN